jgi:hypothetical protein
VLHGSNRDSRAAAHLRYRNLLVRQMVQMKIKISTLLMEAGVAYNKQRLHKADYFRELLATNPHVDAGLRSLLRQCREMVVRIGKTENALIRSLQHDQLLAERVERLMSIPAIGPITALTWALEVGEAQRFSSIKKALSYCGLCGEQKDSGNTVQRTTLSKQRNKHLQTTLIEAAKMAPRYSPTLALLYDREKQKGNANRATLAVARKLVAYLMAVDRGQTHFLCWTGRSTPPPRLGQKSFFSAPSFRTYSRHATTVYGRGSRHCYAIILLLVPRWWTRLYETESAFRNEHRRNRREEVPWAW